jgi:hypothetical protein
MNIVFKEKKPETNKYMLYLCIVCVQFKPAKVVYGVKETPLERRERLVIKKGTRGNLWETGNILPLDYNTSTLIVGLSMDGGNRKRKIENSSTTSKTANRNKKQNTSVGSHPQLRTHRTPKLVAKKTKKNFL